MVKYYVCPENLAINQFVLHFIAIYVGMMCSYDILLPSSDVIKVYLVYDATLWIKECLYMQSDREV